MNYFFYAIAVLLSISMFFRDGKPMFIGEAGLYAAMISFFIALGKFMEWQP